MQRAGALVDVMDALPSALRDRGHEVSVALPFYREIPENRAFKKKDTGITVEVQVGDRSTLRGIWKAAAQAACSCSSSAVMNFLIAPEFMASAASRTKIMPRDLFFSVKRARAGPAVDTAIGDFARARLGAGVGARFCACTRTAISARF